MDVIYYIQGEDDEIKGRVESATDFLHSLKLVDVITIEKLEFKVIETEMVLGEGKPFLAILLEAY